MRGLRRGEKSRVGRGVIQPPTTVAPGTSMWITSSGLSPRPWDRRRASGSWSGRPCSTYSPNSFPPAALAPFGDWPGVAGVAGCAGVPVPGAGVAGVAGVAFGASPDLPTPCASAAVLVSARAAVATRRVSLVIAGIPSVDVRWQRGCSCVDKRSGGVHVDVPARSSRGARLHARPAWRNCAPA